MIKLGLAAILCAYAQCAILEPPYEPSGNSVSVPLRVMTFNTWNTGAHVTDGLAKIAHQVLAVDPDIVAFQEIETKTIFPQLLTLLGNPWVGAHVDAGYPDSAIATKHTLVNNSCQDGPRGYSIGCTILLDGNQNRPVHFWSTHLDYENYGPYAACNRHVTREFQIEAGEYNLDVPGTPGRAQNMLQLSSDPHFLDHVSQAGKVPLFLCGDFNAPSHLDWTDAAKDDHCGWTFQWPASFITNERLEFTDAYRAVHVDPVSDPGVTWSTVQKQAAGWGFTIPEPQDRIDFIYFKGSMVHPVTVEPYQGRGLVLPKPYEGSNDWPSDHYSVVGDFTVSYSKVDEY